jgi:hypothetical protein
MLEAGCKAIRLWNQLAAENLTGKIGGDCQADQQGKRKETANQRRYPGRNQGRKLPLGGGQ